MKTYIKFLTAILLFCTAVSQQVKAQGVDVIFMVDNSGSMTTEEWNGAATSIRNIINNVLTCSEYNRAAVVQYGTPTNTGIPKIYIQSDFSQNYSAISSFSRQGSYFWDDASASLSLIGNALDGVSNSNIQSPQKTLTRNPNNKLVIFLFSDATRLGAPSSSLVSTSGSDLFIVYNQFKTNRNATFVNLHAPSGSGPTQDDLAKAAAAAIASVGGSYNGDVEANAGDPQGSGTKPRKMIYSNTFTVSQTDLDILIEEICTSCAPLVEIDAVTPPTQNVCVNGTPSPLVASATGSPSGTLSYQWYSNTTNSTTGGTAISGATSSTYIPVTTTTGTLYYYVVVSDTYCEGKGTSAIVSVTVSNTGACAPCPAGTTAPPVTPTLANDCTSATPNTVNLGDAHTGTAPNGTNLVWRTDSNPAAGAAVPDPTAVGAGTYYAFYYSSANGGCYSPASNAVTVTINGCATCTDSGITSVDLTTVFDPADLPHPDVVVEWWTSPTRDLAPTPGTLVPNPTNITVSGTYYAFFYDAINDCYNTDNSTASVVVNILPPCNNACYEDPTLDPNNTYPVKHGISILGRAGKNNTASDWPMVRNSAYTALESKTKGFVITRTTNPETAIESPIVGMMVFDTDENAGKGCLKIYTGDGTGEGWKCFTTPACP